MRIIEPSFEVVFMPEYTSILRVLEMAGRTCYKSEPKGDPEAFLKHLKERGHHSVIEHMTATIRLICDRGVLAELSRHRLVSLSVESTRYCNYSKEKFGGEITVIRPFFFEGDSEQYLEWIMAMQAAESAYLSLRAIGITPEQARSVLPNSLKTEIVISCNMREWRHIFKLRCGKASHPQMRQSMLPILATFYSRIPVLFEDIYQVHKEEIEGVE